VDEMAASLIIEEESGTCAGRHHQHNGYYAGDFSEVPMPTRSTSGGPEVVVRIARQRIDVRGSGTPRRVMTLTGSSSSVVPSPDQPAPHRDEEPSHPPEASHLGQAFQPHHPLPSQGARHDDIRHSS
jgi:hypothetical protein